MVFWSMYGLAVEGLLLEVSFELSKVHLSYPSLFLSLCQSLFPILADQDIRLSVTTPALSLSSSNHDDRSNKTVSKILDYLCIIIIPRITKVWIKMLECCLVLLSAHYLNIFWNLKKYFIFFKLSVIHHFTSYLNHYC